MERLIGIGPGRCGAVAVFEGSSLAAVHDMPTVTHRGKVRVDPGGCGVLLASIAPTSAFVERVGAMPGQGVVSMFNFGMAAGIILGALAALRVPTTLVGAAQWKGALRCGVDDARERASQLIPDGARYWPLVKHDGRAEAALIALYGVRIMHGDVVAW